jgi:hypothetical protein
MLESAIVAVLALVVLIAANGILIPTLRGSPVKTTSRRARMRFGLKTLLIVTTLVAILLGLVCYTVR